MVGVFALVGAGASVAAGRVSVGCAEAVASELALVGLTWAIRNVREFQPGKMKANMASSNALTSSGEAPLRFSLRFNSGPLS